VADPDVIVVGAGLAGLSCARELLRRGHSVLVLEGADAPGGRIRTDLADGFRFDRGIQVLQTAYPEARRVLDYRALDLHTLYPGALVRFGGRLHRVADPWRQPLSALSSLGSPIGTLADKLRVTSLRGRLLSGSLEDIYRRPETSALQALRGIGLSRAFIDRFMRPFLASVFFDDTLTLSSRAMEFVLWAFAAGDTAVPAYGMGAITAQLADALPAEGLRTGTPVSRVESGRVTLASGQTLEARAVVVATEPAAVARLLGDRAAIASRGATCLYFASERPPLEEPVLVLNGEPVGPVTSLAVPSNISRTYAPPGAALIAVSVLGAKDDPGLERAVRDQLARWLGRQVGRWQHLRTYRIPDAVPVQHPPVRYPEDQSPEAAPGVYVAGECRSAPSIQWVMSSGRRAAEAASALIAGY